MDVGRMELLIYPKNLSAICVTYETMIAGLLLFITQPETKRNKEIQSPSLITLVKDPYIILIAGEVKFMNRYSF